MIKMIMDAVHGLIAAILIIIGLIVGGIVIAMPF